MKTLVSCSWFLGLALLLLAGCGDSVDAPPAQPPAEEPPATPDAPAESAWVAEVVFQNDAGLGGCAVGELDPDAPGLELIATDALGHVHLVYRDGDQWKHQLLTSQPGELIQCAIGDASPEYPGNEIVAVGMAEGTEDDGGEGVAVMLVRHEKAWLSNPRYRKTFPALVHGVTVADLVPGGSAETVVAGFDRKATVLSAQGDAWTGLFAGDIQGAGKAAVPAGTGVSVAVQGGHVASVVPTPDGAEGWSIRILGRGGASQARLDALGEQLLTAQDDGELVLWTPSPDPKLKAIVSSQTLHSETMKLRGAALGDFDPTSEGFEAASAGYEGKVVVLVRTGATWKPHVVFQDTQSLHHLAHGDVLPDVPGEELLTCGHSGKLVLIRRR